MPELPQHAFAAANAMPPEWVGGDDRADVIAVAVYKPDYSTIGQGAVQYEQRDSMLTVNLFQ